eukprot:Sspe_Gene.70929::Locus_41918_Transcript_1_2_Confidence_0.750_Length_3091::g.70929::m.70929
MYESLGRGAALAMLRERERGRGEVGAGWLVSDSMLPAASPSTPQLRSSCWNSARSITPEVSASMVLMNFATRASSSPTATHLEHSSPTGSSSRRSSTSRAPRRTKASRTAGLTLSLRRDLNRGKVIGPCCCVKSPPSPKKKHASRKASTSTVPLPSGLPPMATKASSASLSGARRVCCCCFATCISTNSRNSSKSRYPVCRGFFCTLAQKEAMPSKSPPTPSMASSPGMSSPRTPPCLWKMVWHCFTCSSLSVRRVADAHCAVADVDPPSIHLSAPYPTPWKPLTNHTLLATPTTSYVPPSVTPHGYCQEGGCHGTMCRTASREFQDLVTH